MGPNLPAFALALAAAAPLQAQIVADFSATPAAAPVLTSVQFTDLSSGAVANGWSWDFGDGSTSTEQDPTHVYTAPGEYTVTLTVWAPGETDTLAKEAFIHAEHLATLTVPGDAATIQQAVDMATPFTEIVVAPGTYAESVVLSGGASVTLRGAGAGATILDTTGLGARPLAVSGVGVPVAIEGFTLTGGSAGGGGAGVRVNPSCRLAVRRCVIEGNTANQDGGGLWVGATGAQVSVEDSILRDNVANDDGGGVAVPSAFSDPSEVTLTRCAILDNQAAGDGGGIFAYGGRATDCVLAGNSCAGDGGGAWGTALTSCFVAHNDATGQGGGLRRLGIDFTGALVDGCTFVGNVAGTAGGGASLEVSNIARVEGCQFLDNEAPTGDGLWVFPFEDTLRVERCTFVGDGIHLESTQADLNVRDTILRGTVEPIDVHPFAGVAVSWSDVEGGWPGTGNIDADPLFVDPAAGALGLLPGSPCLGAGVGGDDMGALPAASIFAVDAPLAGVNGLPSLDVTGTVVGGARLAFDVERGPSSGSMSLVLGAAALSAPFKGGVFVPQPDLVVPGLPLDADGALAFDVTWPATLSGGDTVWLQGWFGDGVGPAGYSSTQGVAIVQP